VTVTVIQNRNSENSTDPFLRLRGSARDEQ
jgi:hypothetical protein